MIQARSRDDMPRTVASVSGTIVSLAVGGEVGFEAHAGRTAHTATNSTVIAITYAARSSVELERRWRAGAIAMGLVVTHADVTTPLPGG